MTYPSPSISHILVQMLNRLKELEMGKPKFDPDKFQRISTVAEWQAFYAKQKRKEVYIVLGLLGVMAAFVCVLIFLLGRA